MIDVTEVALLDAEGEPLKDKGDAPIVKQFAACTKLTGTERETCRSLFIEASSCTIEDHDVADCTTEKAAACPAETLEACTQEHAAACRKDAIAACVKDKAASWVEEYPDAVPTE